MISPFQQKVYDLLKTIPHGRVVTYQSLARALQCRSPRAVGQALRRNPFAPDVPCHRVIYADLTLGGYQGSTAGSRAARKRDLLAKEGVEFSEQGVLVNPEFLFEFPS
ncbi:MAG: MGMT family protein [Verrucomicrobiota bacterium]